MPLKALKAEVAGRTAQDVALQILDIARAGLTRRACLDSAGNDETGFLSPLQEIAASGITPAEQMLEAFHTKWDGDITKIFSEYSY